MGDALIIVIKVCASPKANEMESVGWTLPVSFAVGRQLSSAMGCFYRRMTTLTLEYWSSMLQAASATVSSTCPSFGSCMSGATFDEELAIAITANKLTPVVQAHNSLHKLMADMASASESSGLTPRHQDHAATKGAIAVARHALQLAKDATIVARGVAMLRKVKNIRDGPSQIKKFLTEIPAPERGGIPQGFWTHLSAFADSSEAKASIGTHDDDDHDEDGPANNTIKEQPAAEDPPSRLTTPKAQTQPPESSSSIGAAKSAPLKRRRKN